MKSKRRQTKEQRDKRVQNEEAETKKYNRKYFVLFTIYQPLMIIFTGFFVRIQPQSTSQQIDSGLISATGAMLLLLIGFGLFFSYLRKYSWSGIGFTFFILVQSFPFFFLVNGFWNRSQLHDSLTASEFRNTIIKVYLNSQIFSGSNSNIHGATVVGAAKSALSLSIAFAGIAGRAGYLEAFLIATIGTFFHQLNAGLVARYAVDFGGTMGVFIFGGTMGTVMALLLCWKHKNQFYAHPEYTSNKMSRTLALLGGAFCWLLFPILNMDLSPDLFIFSNGPISTFICISSSVVTMVGVCFMVEQRIELRCFITSIIAGGVVIGASSTNIYNPLGALFMGFLAAILQYIFIRIEVHTGMKPLWSNGILFLFVVQGILGGFASAVFRAINITSGSFGSLYNSLSPQLVRYAGGQIIGTGLSLAFGIISGLLIFLLILWANKDNRNTFYQDSGHWVIEDDSLMEKWLDESEKEMEMVGGTNANLKDHSYL